MVALTLALAPTAWAEEPRIIATYHADNGSLPPDYAWATNLGIFEDGTLTVERCKGYEVEPPGCQTATLVLDPAKVDSILAAARASGLADRPAALLPDPPIGGGGVSGSVMLEGTLIDLPRDPAAEDAARVGQVLQAIAATIPADLAPLFAD